MKHKIILVPKNEQAEKALNFDEATNDETIQISLSEDEFLCLFENGIIQLINNEGCSNIDDFEDDSVTGRENLERVINALNLMTYFENEMKFILIQKVLNLFNEALVRNTGVYFFF